MFKNILLGVGGSAAVGGIGYGIYSSSQVNKKEGQKTTDTENSVNSGNSPEGQGENSQQPAETKNGGEQKQDGGDDSSTGGTATTPKDTNTQPGVSPETGRTTRK